MANLLDKYGIKEVADVMFYEIGSNGEAERPVLYLDTLKVSTVEQTAEEAEARGGKGNPALIIWDYGREINVTLEDALFSAKSMALMFTGSSEMKERDFIRKTFTWLANKDIANGADVEWTGPVSWTANNTEYKIFDHLPTGTGDQAYTKDVWVYGADGRKVGKLSKGADKVTIAFEDGQAIKDSETYFISFYVAITNAMEIEISPNTFPGNYYVTGDTFARQQKTGKDEFFQFIIPCAKVQSEQTLTLEAEGDPSVFNMNLRVLRPADGGPMMKLVKYDIAMEDKGDKVGPGEALIDSYPVQG